MSLFVAGAVFGEVELSLFVAGAVCRVKLNCHFSWQAQYLVKSKRHIFVAGAVFREIMLYFSKQNARGQRKK